MKKLILLLFTFSLACSICRGSSDIHGRYNAIQGQINAVGVQVYDTANVVLSRQALKGAAGLQAGKQKINDLAARCKAISQSLANIRAEIPKYKPNGVKAVNPYLVAIKKTKAEIKRSVDKKERLDEKQRQTNVVVAKLKKQFKANVVREAVKVFIDHFDFSKGGALRICANHAYARITSAKTEYEKDADILQAQLETIKEFEKEAGTICEDQIKNQKEKTAALEKRLRALENLSGKLDSVLRQYGEIFNNRDGTSEDLLLEYQEQKQAEALDKENKKAVAAVKGQHKSAGSIIQDIKSLKTRLSQTRTNLKPYLDEDYVGKKQKLYAKATIWNVEALMIVVSQLNQEIVKVTKQKEKTTAMLKAYAGLWNRLDKEIREQNITPYYKAVDEVNRKSEEAAEWVVSLEGILSAIKNLRGSIKSEVENQVGKIEKVKGIMDSDATLTVNGVRAGKNGDVKKSITQFILNNVESPITKAVKAWSGLKEKYESVEKEFADKHKQIDTLLSYGVWYWQGKQVSKNRPNPQAEYVGFPISNRFHGTEKEVFPQLSAADYSRISEEARAIQNKMDKDMLEITMINEEIQQYIKTYATTLKWSGDEKGVRIRAKWYQSSTDKKQKTLKAIEQVFVLYQEIITRAAQRDGEADKYQAQKNEDNQAAQVLLSKLLGQAEKLNGRQTRNEDIEEILEIYDELDTFRKFYGMCRENETMLKKLRDMKEPLITKWKKDSRPVIEDVVIQDQPLNTLQDGTVTVYKNSLVNGKIVIRGFAKSFYYFHRRTHQKPEFYGGSDVATVFIQVNGDRRTAVYNKNGNRMFELVFAPLGDETFYISGEAVDKERDHSLQEEFPRIKIKYVHQTYQEIAQALLDKLKESYETKNVALFMRHISDQYYGDRYALEQNLRNFFRNADNIRIQPVVDIAQMDRGIIVINFHWNKSYINTRTNSTVKENQWEVMVISTGVRNQVLKSSATLFGMFSNVLQGEVVQAPLPSGMVTLSPSGDRLFLFATGHAFVGFDDPHDMLVEPYGVPAILMNHTTPPYSGALDLGIVSIDSVTTVPEDNGQYIGSDGYNINPAVGHTYAVRTLDNKYGLFEVLDMTGSDDGYGSIEYSIRIKYKYQPAGSRNFH
ncbi:hypothetical protein K8S19_02115 [bacterium]|nr:hypothetical protein [bacterium]